ncbi:MAG: RraA family protein [Acidobacteriota bacterium]|nr:RraA family protein [Acidobacteriota bacterium]
MTTNEATAKWPAGFGIHGRTTLPDPSLVDAFRSVPAAIVSDCMGRIVGSIGLKAYHHSLTLTMCGPALTVRTRPGDNLMIHKAIDLAVPGDVIVIDGGGDLSQALIGGLMRTLAIARKIGGFVIDGGVRDIAEWAEGVIPIYARGHTHRGPSKDGPGEINVPICCAGLAVTPGDLMIGDADGVVNIPVAQLPALLPLVRAKAQQEASIREVNETGAFDSRFNELLRAKGCPL